MNNGVTALMGLSKANKTSHPCLKIQQDNVDKTFIPALQNVTREKFVPEINTEEKPEEKPADTVKPCMFKVKIDPKTKKITSCVEKKN